MSSTSSLAALGAAAATSGCLPRSGVADYEAAEHETWRTSARLQADALSIQRELVRYAVLAPSSHNTQCWKFRIRNASISIVPDYGRRCRAVDPDDHHLFVSLGCAAENLVQAALASGLMAERKPTSVIDEGISLSLSVTKMIQTEKFLAIPARQCTRTEFDSKPLSVRELLQLERAGSGDGVHCRLITDDREKEKCLEFVIAGNTAQMRDAALMTELKSWIRFNRRAALELRDGLYVGTTGNPELPTWLGNSIFELVFRPKSENDKYARQIRSSSGLAVFISESNDPAHWIEAGRCYQRFALQATSMGIRNSMLNQPVEVASIRPAFANHVGLTQGRPDLVVRFGRAPETKRSMRRLVESVLI